MTSQPSADDESLLDEVGEAVRSVGQVPASVLQAGRAAFSRRLTALGAAVASIGYDSLLDGKVQMRSPGGPRIVTFETDSLSIEIAICADRLVGQLIPPAAGDVAMLTMDGTAAEGTADDMGCFVLPPPASGPTRFRCRLAAGEVLTDWMRL